MKPITLMFLLFISFSLSSQNIWQKDTNSNSAINFYTCVQSYAGAAMVDINQDGFTDIFASPFTYFLNNGHGEFKEERLLPFSTFNSATGCSWADLNSDGYIDCIVASQNSVVLLNDGKGGFENKTNDVPNFFKYSAFGAAIGNGNTDNKLDVVFAHANGFHPNPSPCRFYNQDNQVFKLKNKNGYHFTDSLAPYTVPYWSDYDLDGDMDLFIASGPANGTADYDFCYKNLFKELGVDSFERMQNELFASTKQDGQCYNFIDYDNDLDLDLCLSNYYSASTRLYRNDGNGIYVSVNTAFTFATTNLANCWGDYDNDGDLDVIISNDNKGSKYYENKGNGNFKYSSAFNTGSIGTVVNGDIDNDGDLDVFAHGIGNNGNASNCGIYINTILNPNKNWVNLKLIGVNSNHSAIGTLVRMKATINGKSFWQTREVNAQNTFQGQNDLRVHFGLGDAAYFDTLLITWPSGLIETFFNDTVNKFYVAKEGEGVSRLNLTDNTQKETQILVYPNPFSNVVKVEQEQCFNNWYQFQIYSIQGQLIEEGVIQEERTEINTENLRKGLYILYLRGKNSVIKKQLIKSN